jgi:hypothetical protein
MSDDRRDEETINEREFVITMGGGRKTLRFPGMPEGDFFVIDDGGERLHEEGQEIEARDLQYDENGELDFEKTRFVMRTSGDQFVERCVAQIRDYHVTVVEDGEQVTKTYSATDDGDNKINRAFYRVFTRDENKDVRVMLLGAMDRMAGRDTPFREEFDELFAEHPSLLGG